MSPPKSSFPRAAAAGAVVFALITVLACAPAPDNGRIRVAATVLPLDEFSREIAGDRADVFLLLPLGADVHTWQPRMSDIRKLESARILVSIGRGLEPWLDDLLRSAAVSDLERIAAAENLVPDEAGTGRMPGAEEGHGHEGLDPHVWLDFGLDAVIVDRIAAAFVRIDPEGAGIYRQNAEGLKARLEALDAAYRTELEAYRGRRFLVGGHAAFSFLARRYGLEQAALYGLSPDAAPTSRETAEAIARAREEGIRTVYYEPSSGDKLARLIAKEIGADVLPLHPGHNLSPEQAAGGETFFSLMNANLEHLKHGFARR